MILKIDSAPPALTSGQPYTTLSILLLTIAPLHIGQGSTVTYKVQPLKRQRANFLQASSITITSA